MLNGKSLVGKAIFFQQLDSCCSSSVHHAVLQEVDTMVSQADLEFLAISTCLLWKL